MFAFKARLNASTILARKVRTSTAAFSSLVGWRFNLRLAFVITCKSLRAAAPKFFYGTRYSEADSWWSFFPVEAVHGYTAEREGID